MFIRQVPDLSCEQIKNALQDINQRLNYLQSRMPHENSLTKEIIPKLDLSRLGIKENNQAASKIEVPLVEIGPAQNPKEAPKRNRSASFNFSNQPLIFGKLPLNDKTNYSFIQSQQVSQKNLKPNQHNKSRHITPQNSTPIKFVQQPSRNSTPLKTSLEIIQKQMEKQIQNQQFVKYL